MRGFSAMEVAIIVIAMGLVGGSGYYVYQQANNSPKEPEVSQTTNNDNEVAEKVTEEEYKSGPYGFSFKYPSNWELSQDMKNTDRGMEGTITVTSPAKTKVTFTADKGGRGGDCVDESADNERTTRTCHTLEILTLEELQTVANASRQVVYYNERKVTPPTSANKETYYDIGVFDNTSSVPVADQPYLSSTDASMFAAPNGSVSVSVSGPEDDKKKSADYFSTQQVKEAKAILQSVRFIEQ